MNRTDRNEHPSDRRPVAVLALLVVAVLASTWAVPPAVAQNSIDLLPSGEAEMDAECERGQRLFLARDYAESRQVLEGCVQRVGERIEPLVYLTIITVLDESPMVAVDWGSRAVKADPLSPDARYWYGRALLINNRRDEARREWEAGLMQATGHAGLLEGLARFAMEEGEDPKAYGLLNQLLRQGVDEPWIHGLLADLARRKGHWDQALQHLRDSMVVGGGDEQQWLGVGELCLLSGRKSEAVAAFTELVERYPSAAAHAGLGEALFADGRVTEAVEHLQRAVQLDGGAGRYRFNLANVLEILGRGAEAGEHFREYLRLAPEDPMGLFNYAVHLQKTGRLAEALQHIESSVSLAPDLLAAQVTRAELLEAVHRPAEALEVVELIIAAVPESDAGLTEWRERLIRRTDDDDSARHEGQIRLRHIVLVDASAAEQLRRELAAGADFGNLAIRFSSGPSAAQGGDIGWVDPADLRVELREVGLRLDIGEIGETRTPDGRHHFLQRLR